MEYSEKGTAVTKLTLAENYKIGDEWKSNFVRVVFFGKYAEIVNELISNAMPLFTDGDTTKMYLTVEGRHAGDPETGAPKVFQKKDGSHAASFEVIGNRVSIDIPQPPREN